MFGLIQEPTQAAPTDHEYSNKHPDPEPATATAVFPKFPGQDLNEPFQFRRVLRFHF